MRSVRLAPIALVCGLLVGGPESVAAQGVRGWAASTVQYVELRPLEQRTAPGDELVEAPDGTVTYQGQRVFCRVGSPCTYYGVGDVEHTLHGAEDIGFTAWGLGMQGLSFTGLLRGRARLSGEFTWPRSDDRLDAILAYAQLDQGAWRLRLGRQETLSGLGFSGFDGASVRYEPPSPVTIEAYGGRSLARALSEPRNQALQGLVDFLPDQEAWLFGGYVGLRLPGQTSVGLRYQREILGDRSGLVSERASLDLSSLWLRPVTLTGALDVDVAFRRIGKSHLTLRYAGPALPFAVEVTARRYLPYFELSTVWGFFSPVAYHELLGRVSWSGEGRSLWAAGGWRVYEETEAPVIFDPLEDDAWQVQAGGGLTLAESWTLDGEYDLLWGAGGFLNSGEVTLRYHPVDRFGVSVYGTAFQQFEEFRVGEGRTLGGGASLDAELTDRMTFEGGMAVFRHAPEGGQADEKWNQLRGWSALRIAFGGEPGRAVPRYRR
jgi:hypothetical protein